MFFFFLIKISKPNICQLIEKRSIEIWIKRWFILPNSIQIKVWSWNYLVSQNNLCFLGTDLEFGLGGIWSFNLSFSFSVEKFTPLSMSFLHNSNCKFSIFQFAIESKLIWPTSWRDLVVSQESESFFDGSWKMSFYIFKRIDKISFWIVDLQKISIFWEKKKNLVHQ